MSTTHNATAHYDPAIGAHIYWSGVEGSWACDRCHSSVGWYSTLAATQWGAIDHRRAVHL